MDYKAPPSPFPIEGHAGGWKCSPFHGVKKKSNSRSIEKAETKGESEGIPSRERPVDTVTWRVTDFFSSATPLTSHYEHFGDLAPLGQNILSRVRTSIKISAELGEPSSIARSDRKRLTRRTTASRCSPKVLVVSGKCWRRQFFALVPLLASLCQGIGGDTPVVQRGKSDKPRERDFFPRAYLLEDAQVGTRCRKVENSKCVIFSCETKIRDIWRTWYYSSSFSYLITNDITLKLTHL